MANLDLATCDRALTPDGAAPEWVHLFPAGPMTGRDGRKFDLADPSAVVLAFQVAAVDLPIDYEHQNDRPEAKLNGPVPAAGWIKELKAKADGLWGRVAWTATANEMIARKEYRYLSPSFLFHPQTRHIVALKGAGLVHNPNLHLHALASQDTAMQPENKMPDTPGPGAAIDLKAAMARLLGLPAETPVEELLAKFTERMDAAPDPAKYMPVQAVQAMLSDRHIERATASEERAQTKVANALEAGYFHPGMRDWALALCRSDEAAFETFLEKSGPVFAYLFKPTHTRNTPPGTDIAAPEQSPVAAAICAQLGLKPDALKS
jgi:phage I-like protein